MANPYDPMNLVKAGILRIVGLDYASPVRGKGSRSTKYAGMLVRIPKRVRRGER